MMFRAPSRGLWLLLLLSPLSLTMRSAHAQNSSAGTSSGNSSSRNTVPNPLPMTSRGFGEDFPRVDPNFSRRQLVARREELKRRMMDNAAKLLTITHDLQAELETREPVEADAKRLEEIAKLARAVRDGMKQ